MPQAYYAGGSINLQRIFAELVKRSNTADCKSAGLCLRRFESYTLHQKMNPVSLGFSFDIMCIMKRILIVGAILGIVSIAGFSLFYINYARTHDVLSGQSMEPTLKSGQNLKLSFYKGEANPARGDIIEYKDVKYSKLVHRVIGLPGERIKIENNKVMIYNKNNPEGFTPEYPNVSDATAGSVDVELGANQFFVLGDNRPHASDSRIRGPIERQDILARVDLSSLQK